MCYIPIIELKFLDIQFFFIYIPNIQGIYKIYSHFCFSLFYLSKSIKNYKKRELRVWSFWGAAQSP